jgi:hypothetical protein
MHIASAYGLKRLPWLVFKPSPEGSWHPLKEATARAIRARCEADT